MHDWKIIWETLGEETERHHDIQRDSLSSMSPQEFVFINGNNYRRINSNRQYQKEK